MNWYRAEAEVLLTARLVIDKGQKKYVISRASPAETIVIQLYESKENTRISLLIHRGSPAEKKVKPNP